MSRKVSSELTEGTAVQARRSFAGRPKAWKDLFRNGIEQAHDSSVTFAEIRIASLTTVSIAGEGRYLINFIN